MGKWGVAPVFKSSIWKNWAQTQAYVEVKTSNGSWIRDPEFEILRTETMRADYPAAPWLVASFVLCMFRRVEDHHNLLHESPLWEKACVRQVALDKWFPLIMANARAAIPRTKNLDLGGSDTSRLLMLRCGTLMSIREFPGKFEPTNLIIEGWISPE